MLQLLDIVNALDSLEDVSFKSATIRSTPKELRVAVAAKCERVEPLYEAMQKILPNGRFVSVKHRRDLVNQEWRVPRSYE